MTENLISEKNNKVPVLPLLLLVGIIIVTVVFWGVNKFMLEKENQKINNTISSIQNNIDEIKREKEVSVYEILNNYNQQFQKLEKNNNVLKYMSEFENIYRKYKVKFNGFNLSENGEIKTNVTANKLSVGNNEGTYTNVAKFISEYRNYEDAEFDLDFINSFEGMDTIKFNITFNIKDKEITSSNENVENTENNEEEIILSPNNEENE